jgi:hypothetical protein
VSENPAGIFRATASRAAIKRRRCDHQCINHMLWTQPKVTVVYLANFDLWSGVSHKAIDCTNPPFVGFPCDVCHG